MLGKLLEWLTLSATRRSPRLVNSGEARPSTGPSLSARQKAAYQRPEVRRRSLEQAALIMAARAWDGDAQASEFLKHLFPPNSAPGK